MNRNDKMVTVKFAKKAELRPLEDLFGEREMPPEVVNFRISGVRGQISSS